MKLIDADALKKSFEDTVCIEPMPYAFVKQIIDNAPTVEVMPTELHEKIMDKTTGELLECQSNLRPQGEWIEEGTEIGAFGIKYTWNKCNKCGWSSSLVLPKNYCPNCGADMRGVNNENLRKLSF